MVVTHKKALGKQQAHQQITQQLQQQDRQIEQANTDTFAALFSIPFLILIVWGWIAWKRALWRFRGRAWAQGAAEVNRGRGQ